MTTNEINAKMENLKALNPELFTSFCEEMEIKKIGSRWAILDNMHTDYFDEDETLLPTFEEALKNEINFKIQEQRHAGKVSVYVDKDIDLNESGLSGLIQGAGDTVQYF